MKTLVLTCSRSGRYSSGFQDGLADARRSPHFLDWMKMEQESDIARGRSRMLSLALGWPEVEAVLFVDDDISWAGRQMEMLIETECEVIGGLYQKRRPAGGLVFNGPLGEEMPGRRDVVEVPEVGTGFLLLRRAVLEAMRPLVDEVDAEGGGVWHHFCNNGVRDRRYVSEDYALCRNAAAAGAKVWLHRGVRLGHEGNVVFHA